MEYSASIGVNKKLVLTPLGGRAARVRYDGPRGYTEWLINGGVKISGRDNGVARTFATYEALAGLRDLWPILYDKLPSDVREKLNGFPADLFS